MCRCVVKCGDTMWNDSVVHGEYGGVLMQDVKLMWLWNTEWHGMVWRRIRHNGVMRNDGWNAAWRRYGMCGVVWNVGCGIVICNLYLNAMFMAWCEVECGPDVEWCAEMWWCDLMWIMVRCEMWCRMLQFQTWCDVECNRNTTYVEYGVGWNVVSWYVECCIMQDAKVTMWCEMWWCGIVMKNVA